MKHIMKGFKFVLFGGIGIVCFFIMLLALGIFVELVGKHVVVGIFIALVLFGCGVVHSYD